MASPDPDQTLREIARLLAPYLREALNDESEAPRQARSLRDTRYDDANAKQFVSGLNREVTEHALVFFDALRESPHRIDAVTLADQVGALSGRALSGMLTTPLKRHADRLGLYPPWDELERTGRDPTVWTDRDGNAQRIYDALLRHVEAHPNWAPPIRDLLAHPETRRPVPSSIYVWAPEYADPLTAPGVDGSECQTSCLRTDRPGTRAVIYRAHENQGIVALLDVGTPPDRDSDWGYLARGRLHAVEPFVTRAELLERSELARVFAHIQGRRRIPAATQGPLRELLETRFDRGQLPVFLPLENEDRPMVMSAGTDG